MSHRVCDWLDDFLDGELSAPRLSEFEHHLESCGTCSEEVRFARFLRATLGEAVEREPVPSGLFDRVHRVRRFDRVRFACRVAALAASLLLVLGVGSRVMDSLNSSKPSVSIRVEMLRPSNPTPETSPPARVVLGPSSAGVLVPVKTKTAAASVYWIYPELNASISDGKTTIVVKGN